MQPIHVLMLSVLVLYLGLYINRKVRLLDEYFILRAVTGGLGLGATPVAIANMDAVTSHFEPSPKAFLVVPLVGAFFIDILNALVIKFFVGLLPPI